MKRGFTLIEVMAVITILAVIGLIAVIAVDKVIKDNNQKLYDVQVSNIEDAARTWGAKNIKYLPDNDFETISIPLLILKQEGLIDKDITNQKTGEKFFDDMYIDITYKDGIYNYNLIENSGGTISDNLDSPTIIIYDTINKEISLGNSLEIDGIVILRDGTIFELNSGSSYVSEDTNFNSNKVGEYYYKIIVNDGKSFTVTRKITVK
ncbi:MAG: type II secretion system protein [Firmicutes bacterium]|nr:type II secretion system protein [Bacillota bacterium]